MDANGMARRQRARTEGRMTSRVTIHRELFPDPPEVDANGFTTRSFTTVQTDVPARIAGPRGLVGASRTVRVGGSEVEVAIRAAHLPASLTDLADGDLLEVTSGEVPGTWLRVVEAAWQDQATARRVPVFEEQKPEVLP